MSAVPENRRYEMPVTRLAAHLALLGQLIDPAPRPTARERLDEAAGPELARLLVSGLGRTTDTPS